MKGGIFLAHFGRHPLIVLVWVHAGGKMFSTTWRNLVDRGTRHLVAVMDL
jgi:hypothetical protein